MTFIRKSALILIIVLVGCTGNMVLREYKYEYKDKSPDDTLYDIMTIIQNNDLELTSDGNTRKIFNTTDGMFFVDIIETQWKRTGILDPDGNEYETFYRIWIPIQGEKVISIEPFARVLKGNEYKQTEVVNKELFEYMDRLPVIISQALKMPGISSESLIRRQQEMPVVPSED
jgi:hypothetical protein